MKPEEFKQANPNDQQVAIVWGLEGHLDNLDEQLISPAQFIERARPFLEQLKWLAKCQPNHWPEGEL